MLDELESVDQSTIEELTTIEQEQATLRERLETMEAKRDGVSEVVFERVRSDYQARFQALEERASPLREAARVEYRTLHDLIGRMQGAVEAARLAREELDFRRELGEFDDDTYHSRSGEANEELERVEGELALAEEVKERFIAAFPSEEDLVAPATAGHDTAPDDRETDHASPDDDRTAELVAPAADTFGGTPDLELDTGAVDAEAELARHDLPAELPPPPTPDVDGRRAPEHLTAARFVAPEGNGHPEEYPLQPHETSIGRAPGNDIQIQDAAVSRRHAKVIAGDAGYAIIDLGSENGIYVNRERVTERVLEDGDIVEIGPGTKTFIFRRP